MALITYEDKVAINENSQIADINKVTADDMNGIKGAVNENYNEFNNLKNKVLWANSNPYQNFVAQTVTLSEDIEKFKYYTVIYHLATDGDVCFSDTAIAGDGMRTSFAAGNRLNWRGINKVTEKQCEFTDNVEMGGNYGGSTTVINSRCIPVIIIGHYN